jgi:hypothetical protein
MTYKTLLRKLKIEQHEPTKKTWLNSGRISSSCSICVSRWKEIQQCKLYYITRVNSGRARHSCFTTGIGSVTVKRHEHPNIPWSFCGVRVASHSCCLLFLRFRFVSCAQCVSRLSILILTFRFSLILVSIY